MLDSIMVGKQIVSLRKQNNFTQEMLAEKLGLTAQAVSKWENGHTLPETGLLPLLARLLNCTINSLLMPFTARDSKFQDFVCDACGDYGELVMQLYQRLKERFDFTITYNDKFHLFEDEYEGRSATFNIPDKEDFIIRIDMETGMKIDSHTVAVRIPLRNCSGYMRLVDAMPENIKCTFRVSDCKSCTCNCPYCMVYCFEGIAYKQCHFITISLNSTENMEYIVTLVCAEHEKFLLDKARSK